MDLEQEYLKPCGRSRTQSASAFVDWFFSSDGDDNGENEMMWEREGEESLDWFIGPKEYEAMLREHIEAEKQLERDRLAAVSYRVQNMEAEDRTQNSIDESWDIVSTGSVEFADWEEVILE
jgi:hypothetical protein